MGLHDRWDGELSIEIPEHMRGLEGLIAEEAGRIALDPTTQVGVEAAVPTTVLLLNRQMNANETRARRLAETGDLDPLSLPGRLAVQRGYMDSEGTPIQQ